MRCPRPVSKKRVLCITCSAFVMFLVYSGRRIKNSIEIDPTCEELKAHHKIDMLCRDYKASTTGGNLCHDLCISHKIVLNDCIAHKNTTIIFFGKWKGHKIAFKTKKEPHSFDDLRTALGEPQGENEPTAHSLISQEMFSQYILDHIENQLSFPPIQQMYTPNEMLKMLWAPHKLKHDMAYQDMKGLWLLLQRDEFIKFQLLQNLTHIPKVFGFCGQFYAVEQVKTLEEIALRPFRVRATWKQKVKIVLQLLHLQKQFRHSQFGQLHHCDIQPGNFGMTADQRLVALDLDTVFATSQLKDYLEQPSCTDDKNCDFFDCMTACNKSAGKCTRNILTNNMQIICRDLLQSPHWGMPGLLSQMPMYYENLLRPILRKCISEKLPWNQDKIQKLDAELHSLMQLALEES